MTAPVYIGRFAPSPTGPLHFGSIVAALASYLDARSADGRWHLRIDDVDSGRSRDLYVADIPRTLEQLGLFWDGAIQYQSTRRDQYQAALTSLIERGLAFPCCCSRKDLTDAPRGPAGLIYPGTCRQGLPEGEQPRSWRFAVAQTTVEFTDRHAGTQSFHAQQDIGDFIIKRADGLHAYHLAMVLDDASLGVTDIVRGADLLAATAPQILLQSALGLPTPRYLHIPVACDSQGRKLSKTNHAPAVDVTRPRQLIIEALRYLGHIPPTELNGATTAELLDWAVAHWQVSRLPASDSL